MSIGDVLSRSFNDELVVVMVRVPDMVPDMIMLMLMVILIINSGVEFCPESIAQNLLPLPRATAFHQ